MLIVSTDIHYVGQTGRHERLALTGVKLKPQGKAATVPFFINAKLM